MKRTLIVIMVILVGLQLAVAKENDPTRELRAYVANTLWEWDGGGGETVLFKENGYIEHKGWTKRGLITRWEVIDTRTVLLKVERGRTRDLYAILIFKDNLSSFGGFNFLGGVRLKDSRKIEGKRDDRTTG